MTIHPEKPASSMSDDMLDILKLVVGYIIPADPENDLPAASDPAIFLDILVVDRQQKNKLEVLVSKLSVHLSQSGQNLTEEILQEKLVTFREQNPLEAHYLQTITALAYYRDMRVLQSIGVEPRPPFPEGYDVEQGDWDLLKPVRARGPIYVLPDQTALKNSEQ